MKYTLDEGWLGGGVLVTDVDDQGDPPNAENSL